MKKINSKQIITYAAGLALMAIGIMLIKKANLGITPVSSVPLALSEVIPKLTFGNWTIIYQFVCTIAIVIMDRRITLKTVLLIPIGIAFGYFLDLLAIIMFFDSSLLIMRFLFIALGIIIQALGIFLVNRADLMLPPPDALIRNTAIKLDKKYSFVKVCGDCFWVIISASIELIAFQKLTAIYFGTLFAALCTGYVIRMWGKIIK